MLALLALFISSPCVLGVEFHFDCELRDASSVSPEHGKLVLTANVVRLPTEAELLQELGEIYQLHETGLQGPLLRAGEIFFRFGSKPRTSSWTIKRVTRYQALLFYWGRQHGHTFDFRPHRGIIPETPGSERVCCSGSGAGSLGGGPSGARSSLYIPDTPPVGGGRTLGGGSLAARSSGGGGSARGPSCGVAPPRPAYGPTPQVQGRASQSPVTEVNKPAQGPGSAAHQPTAQPGPMQVPPAAREFATFYRQSVCIQQLHYDPISMKLMQTICCAMGIPDPLTALRESRSAGRQHAEEWLYGSGSGGAGAGGAVSGGAGSSGVGSRSAGSHGAGSHGAGSHGAVSGGTFAAPPASQLIPVVAHAPARGGRSEADEEAERLRPGLSFGQGVLPPPPAHPYIFFLHGHRRVEATSFPTTTYSFTHNMVIQWALMQHGLPTPETVMGYAPIEQILPEVEAYLDSHGQHQIWEAFQALVATVQPYQVQTLLDQQGGVLPTYLEDFEQEQVMDSWGIEVQLAQIQHQLDTAFAAGPSAWPCGEGVIEEPPCLDPDSGLSIEDRQAYMRIAQARQRICSSNPRDVAVGLLSLRDFGVLAPALSEALPPPGQAIGPDDLEGLMKDLGYMCTLRIGPLDQQRYWDQCLRTLSDFVRAHPSYLWTSQGRQCQRHLLLEPHWVRFQLVFNPRQRQQTVRVLGPSAAELGTLLAEAYADNERNPVGRQNDLAGLRSQGFRTISVQHDRTADDEGPSLLDGLEPGTEAPLARFMYSLRRLLLTLPMVEVLILRASRRSHAQQLEAARAAAEAQAQAQAQANGGISFGPAVARGGGRGGLGGGRGGGFRPPRRARGRGLP